VTQAHILTVADGSADDRAGREIARALGALGVLVVSRQVVDASEGWDSDAAEMLTLRAAIADYAQWGTTPLDYTMNPFHLFDSDGEVIDPNFTLAVLQQARNSTRMVQAGNHALNYPTYSFLTFLYAQMTADAAQARDALKRAGKAFPRLGDI